MKILAIVGSLRRDSYNKQLAMAAGAAVGERAEFEILDFSDMPFMNQDIEFPTPEPVRRVREAVKAADGIWFFSTEYNHSYTGVLKNLIDWLSRPEEQGGRHQVLSGKKAAVSGISTGMNGTALSQDHLVMLVSYLNMDVMNLPRLTIPNAAQQLGEDGKLALSISAPYLQKQADAFLKFLEGSR